MALFDKLKRSRKENEEIEGHPAEDLAASEHSHGQDEATPEDSSGTSFFDRFRRGKREATGDNGEEGAPQQENAEQEPGEERAGDNKIADTETERTKTGDTEIADAERAGTKTTDAETANTEIVDAKTTAPETGDTNTADRTTSILGRFMPGRKDSREQPEEADEVGYGPGAAGEEDPKKTKGSLMERFKAGLTKTRKNLGDKIDNLIKSSRKLDDEFWEELEDILIQADVGMNTSLELVDKIRAAAAKQKIKEPEEVIGLLQSEITQLLGANPEPLLLTGVKPAVILVVGVNGAGKTTSIAKMAYRLKKENQMVMLAAGDTFRAAAIDQLQIWADRVGVELIKHQEGSDPGAVVFDAISAARARQADVLIVDTAGRLQNKTNLMKEIGKVRRVIERELPDSPQEVLLVLDATTGQNAISQAKIFREATGVTGIILTKLDGTAKGGIVVAVAKEMEIPVKMVGIGETLEDLREFSPEVFAQALFEK